MKQLSLVLVIVLLLALSASSVIAADKNIQVGLDYVASGTIDSDLGGDTIDCTGYRLNGEYLGDKFKVGVNLGRLELESDQHETFAQLSGGYKIVNTIFATLTYYKQTWWGNSTTAYMIGIDALFPVNEKFSIGGYYGTSILDSSLKGSDFATYIDPQCTVTLSSLQLIYRINDSMNVNLKYRVDNSHFTATGVSGIDNTYTWITLGVGYNF